MTLDILLKFRAAEIVQSAPGGDAKPGIIQAGHGEKMCPCARRSVKSAVFRSGVEGCAFLSPKAWEIWTDRHDDRDIRTQHFFDSTPHFAARKTPVRGKRHPIFPKKASHPAHQHQTVDTGMGDQWKKTAVHQLDAVIIERGGETSLTGHLTEGRRHMSCMIAAEIEKGIGRGNDSAAALADHSISGMLLTAAIALPTGMLHGNVGMFERKHNNHRTEYTLCQRDVQCHFVNNAAPRGAA